MNPKGNKDTLRASQPGNRNAEKSGLYSERRRTEKAREVQRDMEKDPQAFLTRDRLALYAEVDGLCELHAQDIAVHGVSDRHGNPRRAVGTHVRLLRMREALNSQFQSEFAAIAAEDKHAAPFSEAEGLRLLRDIAHDHTKSPGASVAAIRILLERIPTPEKDYEYQRYRELMALTDEELERELEALMAPVTTGRKRGVKLEPPQETIRRLASQEAMDDDELLDLYGSLAARFRLSKSRSGNPGGD